MSAQTQQTNKTLGQLKAEIRTEITNCFNENLGTILYDERENFIDCLTDIVLNRELAHNVNNEAELKQSLIDLLNMYYLNLNTTQRKNLHLNDVYTKAKQLTQK